MLLANFDRKEHLQHRAVSLRQHGFLVLQLVANYITVVGYHSDSLAPCKLVGGG